jgi:VWFA-related protein
MVKRVSRISLSIYLLLLIQLVPCSQLRAQTESAPPASIRVTSRIVSVDVVVRDSAGRIVHGLRQEDFHVSEDHKEQKIESFHDYTQEVLASATPPDSKTDPLSFSNVEGSDSHSVNIILFDFFNTAPQDYGYARKQMIKFLEQLPPGRQTALFVLGGKLEMIQSFTASTDRLLAAAKAMAVETSNTRSIGSQQQENDMASAFAAAMGRSPSGRNVVSQGNHLAMAADSTQAQGVTAAALQQIGAAVSGYPGRKNLFWLGETFPVYGGPVLEVYDEVNAVLNHDFSTADMAEANRAEATQQVAIYPINIGGIDASGMGAEASGATSEHEMFTARHALYEMLNNLADTTGGHAYYGTNDFAGALTRGFEDGSSYYSITYHPENHNWNGHFRNIAVKLAQHGYSLSYRRGYYALPDPQQMPASVSPADILYAAMQPETPQESLLRVQAKIALPDAGHPTVRIDSVIDPANVVFQTDNKGRRHARLLVTLEALPDPLPVSGKPNLQARPPDNSGVYVVDADEATFRKVLLTGLTAHQELTLPPGKYRLRLGVCDLTNHRVGTLDMPVFVGQTANESH